MGAGKPVSLGSGDLFPRRCGRAPGGVEVGTGARLPVERRNVCAVSCRREPGGVDVGAGALLPVGRADM